jgi:hypothetical protein
VATTILGILHHYYQAMLGPTSLLIFVVPKKGVRLARFSSFLFLVDDCSAK